MTQLSVNVNKVAYLRNSRHLADPSPLKAARVAIEAGAHGITVHPRPDERHIRPSDVIEIAELLTEHPEVEFNIEGNPFEGRFMELVERVRPAQCTLVPDAPDAFTSDSGWSVRANQARLEEAVGRLKELGARVSLFMDAGTEELGLVRGLGADRIELYTEPYAEAWSSEGLDAILARFSKTAREATRLGLGVNAGHDLNLQNLGHFLQHLPEVAEVSIGHALIGEAIFEGLASVIRSYLDICKK